MVLPSIQEDMLLTLEDDVLPPLTGYEQLSAEMDCHPSAAAVAGMVPCRSGEGRILAVDESDPGDWSKILTVKKARRGRKRDPMLPVGGFGGGFTLWRMDLLRQCLPVRFTEDKQTGVVTGWDYNLCQDLRRLGHRLYLNTRVLCQHDFGAQGRQRVAVLGHGDPSGMEPICPRCHGRTDLGLCECQTHPREK
jgi:hypothetical protein